MELKAILKNSSWGIVAQVAQSVCMSLFFVILARKYSSQEFSDYLVINVIYQLVTAFSALGMSQWFIREYASSSDQQSLQNRFFKVQLLLGFLFYFVNIGITYTLYSDPYLHFLAFLLGLNVVFDNLINSIKCLNIANLQQQKTFLILSLESFFKLMAASLLFFYPISITVLTLILILIRFASLNLFLTIGSSRSISLKGLYRYRVQAKDFRQLIFDNWPFIVMSGVSIVNWRMATLIISKTLTAMDVNHYEICYKLFSIALILPVIVSNSVYPSLTKLFKNGDSAGFKAMYHKVHQYYLLFGLLTFTFVYSFAGDLLPLAFGDQYRGTAVYAREMFLTILVFPTALLKANMLVSMKLEKLDMLFNVLILLINLVLCLLGLHFMKSLLAVNLSVFLAFLCFHVLQDMVLYRRKISSLRQIGAFHLQTLLVLLGYMGLSQILPPQFSFLLFWGALLPLLWTGKRWIQIRFRYKYAAR